MASNVEPIRNEADYDAAMEEVAALWGAASGTPQGDRLDVLATLIDAYEAAHDAMDAPVPRPSGGKVREHRQPPQDKGPHPILTNPPDVRSPAFRAEAHRQSAAVAASAYAGVDQAFIDAVSDRDDE